MNRCNLGISMSEKDDKQGDFNDGIFGKNPGLSTGY
jgi:hypothetical protein